MEDTVEFSYPFPPPDPDAPIGEDLPCRKCGYNLRGLNRTGRCPECATPAGLSASGDLLRYSHPEWLAKLRRGVNLILYGILVTVLFVVLSFVLVLAFGPSDPILNTLLYLLPTGAGILRIVGTWLLTAPDPSGLGEDQYGTSRLVIRVTLLIGLLRYPVDGIQQFALAAAIIPILQLLSVLLEISNLIGMVALLLYLSKLSLRIPDLRLSGRAKFLAYALGSTLAITLLMRLIVVLAVPQAPNAMPLGCISGIVGLAVIVFVVMYVFLLIRFGKAIKEQVHYARQVWSTTA